MPLSETEFRDAISHLTQTDILFGVGALFVDANTQKVFDEGSNNLDITPNEATLTQALIDLQTSNDAQGAIDELVSLAYSDMLVYYRTELVNAAGNGAAIAALYTQAMTYQSQNLKLTDTMLSLRTIEEVGSGVNIDVNTNAGKARYLSIFLLALTMWAIQ